MTPEEFMSSDAAGPAPEADRYAHGGYAVKDPDTGDFRRYKNGNVRGITRVTTFVKAASDSKALNDWNRRNVLLGAAKRPDIVARAWNLTHEKHRARLNEMVDELETVAGAKISADVGTDIHSLTERLDRREITLDDVPPIYRAQLTLYLETLDAAGLEPVPDLMERTTMVSRFGGVAGTFDRVLYHRSSDTYVIGDVKTGKTLTYGINEIEAQMWLYAEGFNTNGLYDWNEHRWVKPDVRIGEACGDGVIIHMPVQGDDAGLVRLRKANLAKGRRYAELCHRVRSHLKSQIADWSF